MTKLVSTDNMAKTHSENFDWSFDCDNEKLCMIFSFSSFYSGVEAPSVTFEIITQDGRTLYCCQWR